jgi:hypothetical protein
VLDRVNDLRRQAGFALSFEISGSIELPPLTRSACEPPVMWLMTRETGFPQPGSRVRAWGFRKGAENVAMAVDLAQAQESLEQSPSHRCGYAGRV